MHTSIVSHALRAAGRTSLAALFIAAAVPMMAAPAFAEMVWNRGNSIDPGTLDPHKSSIINEAHVIKDLFEGLVTEDIGANVVPGVAESWTISDDGTVYTFTLRADAKWSNGAAVTADDFVYAFRRLLNPETGAEYASMLYVVKNGEAANGGEAALEDIGVRAVDASTLEITLESPTPYFLEMLLHNATFPVPQAVVEEFGEDWIKPENMVSNGAFVLTEFIPGDHITIAKNPNFHAADAVQLDKVVYWPTEDRSTAMKRFEAGELDSNDDFPTEQLADLTAKFGDQLKLGPYLGTYYYSFKTDKAPWDNADVRRAISLAIDRDFIADKVWGNTMVPAYGMVPPGIDGYEAYEADYAGMSQLEREDAALEILQGLGYGADNPLKMEIRFNTSENHQNTAVAIQEQLAPLGVEVSMVNADGSTHYAHLQNKGDFDVARAGWIGDYKDPESFLGLGIAANGNNYANFNNAEFEETMKAAAAAGGDPAKRMALLHDAEVIFVDQLPNIPILFYGYHNIVAPKVKGWESNVMDFHLSRYVWIEG